MLSGSLLLCMLSWGWALPDSSLLYLQKEYLQWNFAGEISVWTPEEHIYTGIFPNTQEPIAPIPAPYVEDVAVRLLFLSLQKQQILSLQDPLSRLIPEYPAASSVTLEDVLLHTTGMPSVYNATMHTTLSSWKQSAGKKPLYHPIHAEILQFIIQRFSTVFSGTTTQFLSSEASFYTSQEVCQFMLRIVDDDFDLGWDPHTASLLGFAYSSFGGETIWQYAHTTEKQLLRVSIFPTSKHCVLLHFTHLAQAPTEMEQRILSALYQKEPETTPIVPPELSVVVVGTYQSPSLPAILVVTKQEEALWIEEGTQKVRLYPISTTEFIHPLSGICIRFFLGQDKSYLLLYTPTEQVSFVRIQ